MHDAVQPQPARRARLRRFIGWGLLATSLAGNVALAWGCLEFYRREQRVRLHPTFPVPAAVVARDQRPVVLFLGDSRMQDWPDLPKERFVTVNAGGGGETTEQIRLRADRTLAVVQPKLVVLQAGINDLKAIGALPERAKEIEARCLENLTALVELSRARGARAVLVPILPAAEPELLRRVVWSPRIEVARQHVNVALRRRFGATEGVVLLADDILRADTSADYRDTLHFRPQAYPKLEAATLAAIAKL
jgi:lysophospholipase L1-like esterase